MRQKNGSQQLGSTSFGEREGGCTPGSPLRLVGCGEIPPTRVRPAAKRLQDMGYGSKRELYRTYSPYRPYSQLLPDPTPQNCSPCFDVTVLCATSRFWSVIPVCWLQLDDTHICTGHRAVQLERKNILCTALLSQYEGRDRDYKSMVRVNVNRTLEGSSFLTQRPGQGRDTTAVIIIIIIILCAYS